MVSTVLPAIRNSSEYSEKRPTLWNSDKLEENSETTWIFWLDKYRRWQWPNVTVQCQVCPSKVTRALVAVAAVWVMQLPPVASVQTVLQNGSRTLQCYRNDYQWMAEFKQWVASCSKGKYYARCTLCSDLNIWQGGKSDLMKHKQGKKHKEYESAVNSNQSVLTLATQLEEFWNFI